MALRKGTKTTELVGPIGAGGGRQERRLSDETLRAAAARGVEGTGKSTEDHCIENGPDRDGTVIAVPLGICLLGRICASSAKIWVSVCAVRPGIYRARHCCVREMRESIPVWRGDAPCVLC